MDEVDTGPGAAAPVKSLPGRGVGGPFQRGSGFEVAVGGGRLRTRAVPSLPSSAATVEEIRKAVRAGTASTAQARTRPIDMIHRRYQE